MGNSQCFYCMTQTVARSLYELQSLFNPKLEHLQSFVLFCFGLESARTAGLHTPTQHVPTTFSKILAVLV